ncbi:MAG: hypothetical protein JNL66_00170, partial [Alphaproteobacteria bacterium]|nr:hypothetical protein [Alphaproteobacteria bacterium]
QLLDSADGRIITITATPAGTATRTRGGQQTQVTMWNISAVSGFSDIVIGYTPRGEWAAMHFRSRGSRIDYAEPGATSASMLTR